MSCSLRPILTGLGLLVLAPPLVGCERAWDLANRRRAAADVRALLTAASIPADTLDCHMVGTTRGVECRLGVEASAVARLAATLALTPVDRRSAEGTAATARDETPTELAGHAESLATFAVTGRPAVLRLANGTAFEHLILFHEASSATAWLRLTYSYG